MMRPLRASVLRRVGLLLPRQGWMLGAGCCRSCFCCPKLLMWGRMRGERGSERESERETCTIPTWRWRELPRKCFTGLPDAAIRWKLRRGCPHARTTRHVSVFSKFVRLIMTARGPRLKRVRRSSQSDGLGLIPAAGTRVRQKQQSGTYVDGDFSLGGDKPSGFMQSKQSK